MNRLDNSSSFEFDCQKGVLETVFWQSAPQVGEELYRVFFRNGHVFFSLHCHNPRMIVGVNYVCPLSRIVREALSNKVLAPFFLLVAPSAPRKAIRASLQHSLDVFLFTWLKRMLSLDDKVGKSTDGPHIRGKLVFYKTLEMLWRQKVLVEW